MRAFKWGAVWILPQGESKMPKVMVKIGKKTPVLSSMFWRPNSKFQPFWYLLRKKFIQYLIWKFSIVAWNPKLGLGMVELSQKPDPYEKYSFYFIVSLVYGLLCSLLYILTKIWAEDLWDIFWGKSHFLSIPADQGNSRVSIINFCFYH